MDAVIGTDKWVTLPMNPLFLKHSKCIQRGYNTCLITNDNSIHNCSDILMTVLTRHYSYSYYISQNSLKCDTALQVFFGLRL